MFPTRTQIREFINGIYFANNNNLNDCIDACNNNGLLLAANSIFHDLVNHFELPDNYRSGAWRNSFIEHFTNHIINENNITEAILKRGAISAFSQIIRYMELAQNQ